MASKAEYTPRLNRVSQKAEIEDDPCHIGAVVSRTGHDATLFAKISLPDLVNKKSPNTEIGEWECQDCGEINPRVRKACQACLKINKANITPRSIISPRS